MSGLMPFEPLVPTRDAQFNALDAELILRSSDGVDFAAHKVVLSLSSAVFHDMLSLPQPPRSSEDSTTPDQAIIPMTEDAPSLRLMLCFCYPRTICPEPGLLTLEDIKRAAALAQKYDISLMRDAAEKALVQFAEGRPDVAYAVAWRYEYPVALRAAARQSLEPFTPIPDAFEWEEVPASSVFKLLRYQNSVPTALEALLHVEAYTGYRDASMSWIDTDIFQEGDYRLTGDCTCERLLLRYSAETEQAPHSDPSSRARSLRLVWKWWWSFVRAIVVTMMKSDRPFYEDAVRRALPDASNSALQCPKCKLRDVQGILEHTKDSLRAEIERRLERIPLGAHFMPV